MRLTAKDLELIKNVKALRKRERLVHVMLFAWTLASSALAFIGALPLDLFAYSLLATVFAAIFLPRSTINLEEIAQLLDRVASESEPPEHDELIEALGKK